MNIPEIRKAIIKRRKEFRLTQQQVADYALVSREMISRFENGTHDIGLIRLMRIAGALGLDLIVQARGPRATEDNVEALFSDEDDDKKTTDFVLNVF